MRTLDAMIAVRLTKKQLRELKKAAKKMNVPVGEFVRECAMQQARKDTQSPKPSPDL